MIIGTDTYSAPNLVSLIQSWVASGSASVSVFSSRLRFDKDCTAYLDTFNEPDCSLMVEPQQTTTAPKPTEKIINVSQTTTTPKAMETVGNVSPSASSHQVRAGEIGGFIVGAIIIILLAVLTLVIVVVALKKYKCTRLDYKSNLLKGNNYYSYDTL